MARFLFQRKVVREMFDGLRELCKERDRAFWFMCGNCSIRHGAYCVESDTLMARDGS